jgi:hypothetical protein
MTTQNSFQFSRPTPELVDFLQKNNDEEIFIELDKKKKIYFDKILVNI